MMRGWKNNTGARKLNNQQSTPFGCFPSAQKRPPALEMLIEVLRTSYPSPDPTVPTRKSPCFPPGLVEEYMEPSSVSCGLLTKHQRNTIFSVSSSGFHKRIHVATLKGEETRREGGQRSRRAPSPRGDGQDKSVFNHLPCLHATGRRISSGGSQQRPRARGDMAAAQEISKNV